MACRAARAVLALLTVSAVAHAGPTDMVALPAAHAKNDSAPDAGVELLLPRLDQLVSEAVQDLGLTLALEPRGAREQLSDEALIKRARDSWVVLPTIEREGRSLRVRIVAVRPGTRVMLTRS